MEAAMTAKPFEWGVATLTHRGEVESGDKYVAEMFDGGALVAVIDGLGHGNAAARSAEVAVATLRQHARETPSAVLEHCHAAMRNTRGAAISLASFDWRQR